MRDLDKERGFPPDERRAHDRLPRRSLDDPSIAIVAEVMGGVEPAGEHVLELLARGKHVVTANKQLVARRGAELFAAASGAGVQLRFEASVCAAIPVIKVLRESLVVTNVHRVLGIVNGTTNFMLTEMEAGKTYEEALAEAQARGFAEADPTDDVSGADAAAKMAILATVAFNSRVDARRRRVRRDRRDRPARRRRGARARHGDPARRRRARCVDGQVDVRVGPALVDRHHPLAAVEGAFNAVMLQGDAIREITLEGPGAGGIETASAVIADMASVIGTMGTGFLQNDPVLAQAAAAAAGREPLAVLLPPLGRRPAGRARAGRRRARRARGLGRAAAAARRTATAPRCTSSRTRRARARSTRRSAAIAAMPEVRRGRSPFPVVSDRGVTELGWA